MNAPMPALYKVLIDGNSWHGGAMKWSLPTQNPGGDWTPGAWQEVSGEVVLCQNGLHLTDRPMRWFGPGARIYEAEAEGVVGLRGLDKSDDRKVAAKRVRLLREVEPAGFIDAEEAKRAVREASSEARRILDEARTEADTIVRRAVIADRADDRREKRERANRLRAASLTPAQRKRERRAGKVAASTAFLLVATSVRGRGSNSGMSGDHAVWLALRMAIDMRADFDPNDVVDIKREFHPDWGAGNVTLEGLYEHAAKVNHAPALVAIERALGRKPWVVRGKRLARDSRFSWEGHHVKVTTFNDTAGTLTACSYTRKDPPAPKPCGCRSYDYDSEKIARRFKITRAAFDAAFPAGPKKDRKAAAR